MKTVRRRWILITTLCSVALLWTFYMLTEFQFFMPYYNNVQLRQYYKFESDSPNNINDTLIDLEHFEYIINNVSICKSPTADDRSFIVIIVHSARSHFMQRYAIRETWGSIKEYKGWTFQLVFLLGIDPTSNDEFDARILDESKRYGDIVMGSFVDSYKNLTYKHLMGYKWVQSFCSNSKFVLKSDDDIFVDIFQLVEVILVELLNSEKTYACQNMGGNKPMRHPKSTWYVSEDLYSGEFYPDFCSGSVYLMKSHAAAQIYSVCNQSKFLWIDDVFVTGILRDYYNDRLNISNERLDILTLNNRYNLSSPSELKNWCSTGLESQMKYTFVLIGKDESIRDMFCVWNKVRLLKFAVNNAIASDRN